MHLPPSEQAALAAQQPQVKHLDIFGAVEAGDEGSVDELLSRHSNEILERRGGSGEDLPFLVAAREGHIGIMRIMHDKEPRVVQQTNGTGWSALHVAAIRDHVDVVNQLMEWDPKLIDARTKLWAATPFIVAGMYGKVDVLKAMFDKKGQEILTQ